MHCFVLFYQNGKVYQLEHPDPERVGIHEYNSKEKAINFLVNRYEKMTINDYKEKGIPIKEENIRRTTTKFDNIAEGLTYKELNLYINELDNKIKKR